MILALISAAWISRLSWFRLAHLLTQLKRFFVVSSNSELAVLFLESLFRGFLVASVAVGLLLAVAAVALIKHGQADLNTEHLKPKHTMRSVKKDKDMVMEKVK